MDWWETMAILHTISRVWTTVLHDSDFSPRNALLGSTSVTRFLDPIQVYALETPVKTLQEYET